MELFDSHAHLAAHDFDADRSELLVRARAAGVNRTLVVASTPFDAARAVELFGGDEGIWFSAGVHPHEAGGDEIELLDMTAALLSQSRVVAVGEAGLDYHYDLADRAVQRRLFDRQLSMAEATSLPIVVHSREADNDMLAAIRAHPGVVGVLHCFSGGQALMDGALEAGWYLGYGGIATFKRFDGAEMLRAVPNDRLLLETDSPYLAPVPYRGKRNEPAFMLESARRIAQIRGVEPEALAQMTTANTIRFLQLELA